MRRRAPAAPVAPPAPPDKLLRPKVEDWASPGEFQTLREAKRLADDRWRAAVHEWKAANPAWHLVLDIDWHRALTVGDIAPTFADRDAFEWAVRVGNGAV